jgi:hypothetical protein
MLKQIDKRMALGLSCIVTAALVLTAACTISPPDGVFQCRDGKCPDGQTCDRDSICRAQPLAAPDAGPVKPPDGGTTVVPDTGVATVDMCEGGCPQDKPACVEGVCKECDPRSADACEGDRPLVCTDEGTKQLQDACSGDNPICNSGVCGALRLRGGLGAAGPLPKSAEGVHLIEHTLTRTAPQCADIGGERVCLRGGLQP